MRTSARRPCSSAQNTRPPPTAGTVALLLVISAVAPEALPAALSAAAVATAAAAHHGPGLSGTNPIAGNMSTPNGVQRAASRAPRIGCGRDDEPPHVPPAAPGP